jgi:esterase/lipase superfamily enzyme
MIADGMHKMKKNYAKTITWTIIVWMLLVLTGCGGVRIEPLMPTPLLFTELGVSSLDHIPKNERWNPRRIYYATNRKRDPNLQRIQYTNQESEKVSMGLALVGFGGSDMTWAALNEASGTRKRDQIVELSIAGLLEAGSYEPLPKGHILDTTGSIDFLLSDLNNAINSARSKDLLVYVHGAKVNFYNACAFTAQLDHFMGRDMTSLAFAWPTHQNILSYGVGADLIRAYRAAEALTSVVSLLAEKSRARRIHLLAWSAGGRVLTRALHDLWAQHPTLSSEEFKSRYRLGTVYFAASDVPREEFLAALPALNRMGQRVVVTATARDQALEMSRLFIRGGPRIGQLTTDIQGEQLQTVLNAEKLEVVDLSRGSEARGFDITGHRYWFNHPWASSDVILAIRSDLGPAERGLKETDIDVLWYIPEDYPLRLRKLVLLPHFRVRQAGPSY